MEVRDREVNDPRGRNKSRDDEYTPRYTDTEVHQNLTLHSAVHSTLYSPACS